MHEGYDERSLADLTRTVGPPLEGLLWRFDVMWAVFDVQSTVAAISLDTEKAFDMADWGYLFKMLEFDPEAAVQTNGLVSDYFRLGTGTRQASPCLLQQLYVGLLTSWISL